MATSGSFTIGGTSPDYATIQAWADSPTGDLTGVYEGRVRAGTYDENVAIDTAVATTASNYMKLVPDTGAHHGGDLHAGVEIVPTTAGHVFTVTTPYTRIIGMNVHDVLGRSAEAFRVNGDNIRIEECLIWRLMNLQSDGVYVAASNVTTYVSNCFFGWTGRVAIHYQGADNCTLYAYNCTAIWIGANQGVPEADNDDSVFGGHNVLTTGNTYHFKNCFAHRAPSGRGKLGACYGKDAASSFGNSTNNASDDTSAPGTNPQTGLSLSAQVINDGLLETAGENTADDYSATTEDSYMNADATSTNYGSATAMITRYDSGRTPPQEKNVLIRFNAANIPATSRLVMARLKFKAADAQQAYYQIRAFLSNRNWVEGEVTWNNYSTGNAWSGGGAGSTADVIEDGDGITTTHPTSPGSDYDSDFDSATLYSTGADLVVSASALVDWLADARDGTSPVPKGGDWLDLILVMRSGPNNQDEGFQTSEASDGNRPSIEFYYDTAASPFDFTPDAGGSLDLNGTDLSSDVSYPISTDITGATRVGTWDIGSYSFAAASALDGAEAGDSATVSITLADPGGIDGWSTSNYLKTSTPVESNRPLMMSCWGYLTEASGTTGNWAMSVGIDGTTTHKREMFVARVGGAESFSAREGDAGGTSSASTGNGTVPIGEWFHMGGAFVSSTLREAWINGGNKGSDTATRNPNAPDSTHIGVNSNAQLPWGEGDGGALAEFSVWDLTGFSVTDRNNLASELSTLVNGVARSPLAIDRDSGEAWEGALVWYVEGETHTDTSDQVGSNNLTTTGTLTTFSTTPPPVGDFYALVATDGSDASDVSSVTLIYSVSASDGADAGDSVVSALGIPASAIDGIEVSDDGTLVITILASVVDGAEAGDSSTVSIEAGPPGFSTLTIRYT